MSLLPLNQDNLGHHQCGDEDEHHLGVHGLMAPVLHVKPLVLHSAGRGRKGEKRETEKGREKDQNKTYTVFRQRGSREKARVE